jgi:hypothetical protein
MSCKHSCFTRRPSWQSVYGDGSRFCSVARESPRQKEILMVVYIAVPRIVGGLMDKDASVLSEELRLLREDRLTALGELQALIDGGYTAVAVTTRYAEQGIYNVYTMERKADQTQLDPQSAASVG